MVFDLDVEERVENLRIIRYLADLKEFVMKLWRGVRYGDKVLEGE